MLRSILARAGPETRRVAKGAGLAFAFRAIGVLANFGLAFALARLVGAADSGAFFLALTVATVGSMIARLGLDNPVLRLCAAHADRQDWPAVKGIHRTALSITLLAGVAVALPLAVAARPIALRVFGEARLIVPLVVMSIVIVPMSLFTLYAQLLKGLQRVGQAVLILSVIVPVGALASLPLVARPFGLNGIVGGYALATVVCAGLGAMLWARQVPAAPAIRASPGSMLRGGIPLLWHSVLQMVIKHAPLVLLGILVTSREVGLFAVAFRTAFLITFVLIAVNATGAARFSAMYARGDLQGIERLAQETAALMAVVAAPLLLVFVFAPKMIMSMYGQEFGAAGAALSILAVGQFLNVASGPVQFVLMMCERERAIRNVSLVAALSGVAMCFWLIPAHGVVGAAIATSSAWLIENALAVLAVRRDLGFWVYPWVARNDLRIKDVAGVSRATRETMR